MKEIAINKRIIFDNLVVRDDDGIMLMNLFSFRRIGISKEEYNQLALTYSKVLDNREITEEDDIYLHLKEKKQILSDELIAKVDKIYKNQSNENLGPVRKILINLSYKCNLNCGYCYQKHFEANDGRVTSSDIVKIDKYVKKYNKQESSFETVVLSGGEPLLKENIETINTALNVFEGKNIELFTNGINILKYAEQIDYSKFKEIQLSLDGDDAVIGSLSNLKNVHYFNRILNGIHYLASKGCAVTLACIISPGINEWIEDFLSVLDENNIFEEIKSMRISIPTIDGCCDVVDKRYFTIEEYLGVKEVLEKNNYNGKVILDSLPGFSRIRRILYRPINEKCKGETHICKNEVKTPLAFGPKGHVYWCLCKGPEHAILGDYYKNTINETMLKDLAKRNIFNIEECRKCKMRYVCSSGCPINILDLDKYTFAPACEEFNNEFLVDRLEDFIL